LSLYGDFNGQINALDLGEKRIHALFDEYGDGHGRRVPWPNFDRTAPRR
jgi:N-methylhydantoinase B/oxoprolinase/acetone carboxylase alpha subunit